jgi:predicted peptidase
MDGANKLPEAREWQAENGVIIRYRWAVPEPMDLDRTYPLVLFLHGAGERGTDNMSQLRHCVPDILRWTRSGHPAFVIAPQCPAGRWWVPVDLETMTPAGPEEPNARLDALMELLDELLAAHPIDPDRVYLTGISMGGFGTWSLLAGHPDKFAAAIPVCGGGHPDAAKTFPHVPVWAFHGAKDEVVPVLRSREMIDALREAGGSPGFTVYPDVAHDSWTATFRDPEVLRWMFAHRKR